MPKKLLKKPSHSISRSQRLRSHMKQSPKIKNLKSKINQPSSPSLSGVIKLSSIFIIINIAYLIVLPLITAQFVPCLTKHPFASYTNNECTVEGALDMFMKLAITGLTVLTLTFLLTMRRYLKLPQFHNVKQWAGIPSKKVFIWEFVPLVITALVMAASIVVFYFIFIGTAEHAVRNAPIILSTISKP
jgi:hypothetical protein